VGDGAKTLVRRMLEYNNCRDEDIFSKVLTYYNNTYDNDFLYLTKAYEGIHELLDKLKGMGIKIAVLSNKPHKTAVKVLDSLFGENYFDACYGGREGIPLKPNPQGLTEIVEKLNAKPEECLYIGDTATDMQTGKNAEVFTVGVLWGFRGRAELEANCADLIISHPHELLEYVVSIKA
jgi:phosphoglycolate phosphatase